jgi:hypothetical protein
VWESAAKAQTMVNLRNTIATDEHSSQDPKRTVRHDRADGPTDKGKSVRVIIGAKSTAASETKLIQKRQKRKYQYIDDDHENNKQIYLDISEIPAAAPNNRFTNGQIKYQRPYNVKRHKSGTHANKPHRIQGRSDPEKISMSVAMRDLRQCKGQRFLASCFSNNSCTMLLVTTYGRAWLEGNYDVCSFSERVSVVCRVHC